MRKCLSCKKTIELPKNKRGPKRKYCDSMCKAAFEKSQRDARPRVLYASQRDRLDLSGDVPVIHWWDGTRDRKSFAKRIDLDRKSRPRGASLLYSRVWLRSCACCSTPFVGRVPFAKFCSGACEIYGKSQLALIKKTGDRECRVCQRVYQKKLGERVSKYCSDECRAQFRRVGSAFRCAYKRAIDKGVRFEMVDPLIVFQIQKYRCQICRCTCTRDRLKPTSATLDHIIALGNGGTHTWDNVQTACFKCNALKNNKPESPQDQVAFLRSYLQSVEELTAKLREENRK